MAKINNPIIVLNSGGSGGSSIIDLWSGQTEMNTSNSFELEIPQNAKMLIITYGEATAYMMQPLFIDLTVGHEGGTVYFAFVQQNNHNLFIKTFNWHLASGNNNKSTLTFDNMHESVNFGSRTPMSSTYCNLYKVEAIV